MEPVRLDKWLWAARFFKTRSLAAKAVMGGKVDVNGERAKPARVLRPGDRVSLRRPPYEQHLVVRGLASLRGPAATAIALYEETPESRAAREKLALVLKQSPTPVFQLKGRPTKRDRRTLERWRGRGQPERPAESEGGGDGVFPWPPDEPER